MALGKRSCSAGLAPVGAGRVGGKLLWCSHGRAIANTGTCVLCFFPLLKPEPPTNGLTGSETAVSGKLVEVDNLITIV